MVFGNCIGARNLKNFVMVCSTLMFSTSVYLLLTIYILTI